MQIFQETKKIIELSLLWEISKALDSNSNPCDIVNSIGDIFKAYFNINNFKIWLYNENNDTVRDFTCDLNISNNNGEKTVLEGLKALDSIQGRGLIINDKLIFFDYKEDKVLSSFKKAITANNPVIMLPVTDNNRVTGLIEISNPEFSSYFDALSFLMSLNIISTQISTAIINLKLREHMQQNINFHKVMKDIAKIIESQWEMDYIIPLIGEMIDKFVSHHFIYIFNKDENNDHKLLWPGAYFGERLDPLLKKADNSSNYIISEDRYAGVFPLAAKNRSMGIIAVDGKNNKLTEKEINYIERLSHQTAITLEKADAYAEILKQATIDTLTGLNNRRQFEFRLAQEISIVARRKSPFCLAIIDIDHFKSINDTYGHPVGDKILHDLAEVMRNGIRTYDVAARYGGEEFCILLPHANIKKAQLIADRLRKKIEKTKFDIASFDSVSIGTLSITTSIGISEFDPDRHDYKKLYEEADAALYKAKQEGRNRVVLFNAA